MEYIVKYSSLDGASKEARFDKIETAQSVFHMIVAISTKGKVELFDRFGLVKVTFPGKRG